MKALMLIGAIVLVLGIVSFVMPFPHYHNHGIKVGDSSVGVTTEHDEKLPPAFGIIMVVIGAALMVSGKKA